MRITYWPIVSFTSLFFRILSSTFSRADPCHIATWHEKQKYLPFYDNGYAPFGSWSHPYSLQYGVITKKLSTRCYMKNQNQHQHRKDRPTKPSGLQNSPSGACFPTNSYFSFLEVDNHDIICHLSRFTSGAQTRTDGNLTQRWLIRATPQCCVWQFGLPRTKVPEPISSSFLGTLK